MKQQQNPYRFNVLKTLKQSFMTLLFLLTLLLSFQTMASERYMPNKFNIGLVKVAVDNNQLLVTYKLVIGSDYKDIEQIDLGIELSTHESLNQNPPPSYPIRRELNTRLSDWQEADGGFYEGYELTVPFAAEEGAFFISQTLTFKDKDGKVIEQKEFVHAALLMNDIVISGASFSPSILDEDSYSVQGLINGYANELTRKQSPELVEKEISLRKEILDESRKDGKDGYQSKSLKTAKEEREMLRIKFLIEEDKVEKEVREEYFRRFLNQKP